jgi:hypothetical protein
MTSKRGFNALRISRRSVSSSSTTGTTSTTEIGRSSQTSLSRTVNLSCSRSAEPPVLPQALMNDGLGRKTGSKFHVIANPIVSLDGERATSDVTWTTVMRTPEGRLTFGMFVRHRDVLTNESGRRKFLRREGKLDVPAVFPNVLLNGKVAPGAAIPGASPILTFALQRVEPEADIA